MCVNERNTTMAKFKQVTQTFLFRKLVGFWGNMVKNYKDDVQYSSFFEILLNGLDHDEGVALIEAAYPPDELTEKGALRQGNDRRGGRLRRLRVDLDDTLDDVFKALWNHRKSRTRCRKVLLTIRDRLLTSRPPTKNDVLESRFQELKRVLKLSDLEAEILFVAYAVSETGLGWPRRLDDREKPLFFAMALDRAYGEVMKALTPKGRLRTFNLLDEDWDFNGGTLGGYLDGTEDAALERRFYGRNPEVEILPWSFYGRLADTEGEVLKRLLSGSPGKCNILLYGAPGTGKTSFARTLAKEVGRTAWEIRQGGEDGRNMKAETRMMGIQVCNSQENADESLMIVDEADELLRGNMSVFDLLFGGASGGKSTEKGVMNTILDEMKMPAIWISNTPAQAMDESVRRRFDYSICFEELNHAQRVSIWRNVVQKLGLGRLISEARIADYAGKYATSAGGISTVLANVKRMSPGKNQVDEVVATLMKPHCRLMGIKGEQQFLPARGYSLEGLNIKGKVGLDKVVKAVRNYLDAAFNAASEDKPRMNLLMFGPPGTGKTEFVKYLGQKLDRKVLVMKGSDILSKYVGESEQNIAKAFRRAEAEHAILFFDEIDGLVQDRANARASWEIAQVNELLQQMENFNGVMVAATNFCTNLDAAIMRRFTFKLEFDYLDDAGKKSFFERMFKTTLTEDEFEELKTLRNLAPGDFRTVRQEACYLDEETSNADLIAALRAECLLKKDGDTKSRIGFAA